jgi:hypothetical protein
VITGDISEAKTIEQDLAAIESRLSFPIYFVLGNHDFYNGSIAAVRKVVAGLCRRSRRLHYLSDEGVIPLNETTALVGHDGWADGRLGDYAGSTVELTDYTVIEEFMGLSPEARLPGCTPWVTRRRTTFVATYPRPSSVSTASCLPRTCRLSGRRAGTEARSRTTTTCPTSPAEPSATRWWRS